MGDVSDDHRRVHREGAAAVNNRRHLQAGAIYGGLDDNGRVEGGKTGGEGVTAVVRPVLRQHVSALNPLIP